MTSRRGLRAAIGAVAVGALGSLMGYMVKAVTRDGLGSGTRGTTTRAGAGAPAEGTQAGGRGV